LNKLNKLDGTRRAAVDGYAQPPPDVTLTFDLLDRKSNQYVSRPRNMWNLLWWNYLQ